MKIEPLQAPHLAQLIIGLSDVTRAEAQELGLNEWQVAHELRAAVRRGAGDAVSDKGGLLFALAHEPHPIEAGVRVTSFAATQRYFHMGASGVRLGRKYIALLQERRPGTTFEAHTFSLHPAAGRWFRLLGFRHVEKCRFRLDADC